MTNLIYQVCVGQPSKLYSHCIASVAAYAKRINAHHIVQIEPILKIRPDINTSGRSKEATNRLGYLPIFEKENAFSFLNGGLLGGGTPENIAVIDADVYIRRSTTESIFNQLKPEDAFAAMREADLPMLPWYTKKLQGYSRMQYGSLWPNYSTWMDNRIAPFRNMGVMVFNKSLLPFINGRAKVNISPEKFIRQPRFKKFVDGVGAFKWSTDQTLLNSWLVEDKVPVSDLDWKWNCLYTTVNDNHLREAKFIHFFLKDKLPNRGENVKELMKTIGE